MSRMMRECPYCNQKIRLPSGSSGTVSCPKCSKHFFADTRSLVEKMFNENGKLKAAVGVFALAVISFNVFATHAKLRVCNSAPYAMQHVVIAASGDFYKSLGGWFTLNAGECAVKKKVFWFKEPEFYVHSNVKSGEEPIFNYMHSMLNTHYLQDGDQSNDNLVFDLAPQSVKGIGGIVSCARSRASIAKDAYKITQKCGDDEYSASLLSAYTNGKKSRWYFVWEHPTFSIIPAAGSLDNAIDNAMEGAQQMRRALNVQLFNAKHWGETTPFSVGANLLDVNGPFAAGVHITDAATKTIYGQPASLNSGDMILRVNGTSILGVRDLNQALINHALSREQGIEKPVEYLIRRGENLFTVNSTYFFDYSYRRHRVDHSNLAFWYGVSDGVLFGQTPWVKCNGNNGLRAVANGASNAAEWARSKIQKDRYRKSNTLNIEYIDAKECTWQEKQKLGLARQQKGDTYINAQWFAIVTPSAVRVAGVRVLKANGVIKASKGAMAYRLADAGLEAAETALWSLGTSAPGIPMEKRLKEAAKLAPLGAAAGFITSAVPKAAN